LGRRYALILNIIIFLTGGCIQTIAPSLAFVAIARFIVGIATGFSTVLVPIYLGELAPPSLRGAIGTVNQFAFVIGILAADLLSFRFATEDRWRQLFSVTVIVTGFQLVLSYFVVESPRWLIQKDPNDPRAKHILQKLRGYETQEELEHEFSTYAQATKAHDQESESHFSVLAKMMTRSQDRYLFFCIIILHASKKLSGVNAVFYYSTSLFEGIIDDPLIATTLIGTVNVVFTYVALLLMDSCRRKSLILWSLGGMFVACSTLILAQIGILGDTMGLVAVSVYVAFFAIGVGPIPWLIVAEMFEAKYVTAIMIFCSQLAWTVEFLVSLVFPSINRVLGEYTFVPFAINLALSYFFVWVALPETQGRTPAQVLVDVKLKASYADKLSVTDLGGCSGGDWKDKVLA
jgi:SP family facilitated glucose transporter-like MFS transporter 3